MDVKDPADVCFSSDGMAAVDPSSDWNAPAEHWGNYDEVVAVPAPPSKEQPVTNKVTPTLCLSVWQDLLG